MFQQLQLSHTVQQYIKDGNVKKGDVICEWDPYNAVIVSEINGKIEFNDIIEGISFRLNLMSR